MKVEGDLSLNLFHTKITTHNNFLCLVTRLHLKISTSHLLNVKITFQVCNLEFICTLAHFLHFFKTKSHLIFSLYNS